MLNDQYTNPFINDFANHIEKKILIIKRIKENKELNPIFINLIFSALISNKASKKIKDQFLFIDDASSIVSSEIKHLFNKSNKMGLKVMLFTKPFDNEINAETSKIINDNSANKIYMKMDNVISIKEAFSISFNKILQKASEEKGYMGSKLDMRVSTGEEEILALAHMTKIKEREFILNSNEEVLLCQTIKEDEPDYNKIKNELLKNFKEVVSDKILIKIVEKGLSDIDLYQFKNDCSINGNNDIKYNGLIKENILPLMNVNLKEHSYNVFYVALSKFKKDTDLEIALVASLFHDFGKSELIRDKYIGTEYGDDYKKHTLVSKIYIEEELKPLFKEDLSILETISMLVENHHTENNKLKRNKEISFISTSDYKARTLEVEVLENKNFMRANFLNKLKFEEIELEKENEERAQHKKDSEAIIEFRKKKIILKRKVDGIITVDLLIKLKEISHIEFNYSSVRIFMKSNFVNEVSNVSNKDKDKLIELV